LNRSSSHSGRSATACRQIFSDREKIWLYLFFWKCHSAGMESRRINTRRRRSSRWGIVQQNVDAA
jgi:hypothetical protein